MSACWRTNLLLLLLLLPLLLPYLRAVLLKRFVMSGVMWEEGKDDTYEYVAPILTNLTRFAQVSCPAMGSHTTYGWHRLC